ncbi:ERI1 exoribonuclease 2 [Synchiropus splendidus]|uniref:ERI1 exoribonuclease 2 n=1 Tax=Synchiropus splendidus TaxID=270530 RepID=UPI00237E3783|nr:ERI1 exoribonuclease 2 [Synchiropus splendidus]
MSTKKLAKELGLVRQRSKSTSEQKKATSNQIFSYLIVIDFESTCWREKNNLSQEIIEFPAVLLNTSTGEVESEFHTYVQPQERPLLSDFCTELTGITQAQVEAGIPLRICLSQFSRWLQKLQLQMGVAFPSKEKRAPPSSDAKLCTFLTWSDWDLGVCLQYECKRKQIHKPDVLNSWIDLRSTYRLFYNRKPKGLNGALQDLGIQFAGREHSGLDDARNTAQLAWRMMRDGCVMKITRTLDRTPPVVRPGNASNTDTRKEAPRESTSKPQPPSKRPLKSCHSDPASVTSLVSPRTLLDTTNVPQWERSNIMNSRASVVKLLSAANTLPNGNIMCSTVPPLPPDQTWEEEELLTEAEERCGSYDDVVLEDEGVASEAEEHAQYVPEFDSGCDVWEDESVSPVRLREGLGAQNTFVQGHSSSHVKITSQHQSSLKTRPNLSFKKSVFIPEKTSTPHGSLFKRSLTREKPFSILADPEIQPSVVSHPVPRNVLASSTNTSALSRTHRAGANVTAPLCGCGRRAKRQVVSNGGPNQGRAFFCCAVRRSGSGCRVQKGCDFFSWAPSLMRSRAAGSSVSMFQVNSTFKCPPPPRVRKSC